MLRWRNKVTGPRPKREDTPLGGKRLKEICTAKGSHQVIFLLAKMKTPSKHEGKPQTRGSKKNKNYGAFVTSRGGDLNVARGVAGPRTWSILPKLKFMNR